MKKPSGKLAFAYATIANLEEKIARLEAAQPAPVANTWPKLSFMAIAAGEHAHADYCQKHAYSSLNEYRNHEALTHAIEVAVAYDKLNSKPAPGAVVMPARIAGDHLNEMAQGWNSCIDAVRRLNDINQ